MIEETDFETYLNISPYKFGIYLFEKKNFKNLYKKEIIIKDKYDSLDSDALLNFLDENIFKIEKQIGKFIKNICITIESKEIFNLEVGIKTKNYDKNINLKNLEVAIIELKDLFRESNYNQKIMHILITNYLIDNTSYKSLINNVSARNMCLEVKFISISNDYASKIEKVLEKYHIKIIQYLDAKYIKDFFKNDDLDFSQKVFKIRSGQNVNEVKLIPKNPKKKGFFEKFFQLFS